LYTSPTMNDMWAFKLAHTSGASYFLKARSKELQEIWVAGLNAVVGDVIHID